MGMDEVMKIPVEGLAYIVEGVLQVYPMVIVANLTKNTYHMIGNEQFLYRHMETEGRYEDMIDENVDNIHDNYQHVFLECFSREHLLDSFRKGKTEVYAEIYQKNQLGEYHWVSIHVIKITNKDGDVCHVCLNRVLDGIDQERHGAFK
jgi:hypothetical protein